MRVYARLAMIILICCGIGAAFGLEPAAMDGEEAEDYSGWIYSSDSYLEDYIRVRCCLDGRETVFHWTGMAYGMVPGEKRRELFAVEGYTITRAVRKDDGYSILGREVLLWLDHRTGQILTTWRNPYTGKDVDVYQAFNDPVNQDLGFTPETLSLLPMILPSTDLGDQIAWHADIFPYYSNPLPRRDYPFESQSDTFQAGEFGQYIVQKRDLADTKRSSLPAVYTRTEILPWLPFMLMGDRPGNVVLVGRGRKLEQGFAALPAYLKEYVLANRPEFATAPDTYSEPNATIWSSFRAQREQERADQALEPEPVAP